MLKPEFLLHSTNAEKNWQASVLSKLLVGLTKH